MEIENKGSFFLNLSINTSGQEEYELREFLCFKCNVNAFKWTFGVFYFVKFKTSYPKHVVK